MIVAMFTEQGAQCRGPVSNLGPGNETTCIATLRVSLSEFSWQDRHADKTQTQT
jgi:hypothetical protein